MNNSDYVDLSQKNASTQQVVLRRNVSILPVVAIETILYEFLNKNDYLRIRLVNRNYKKIAEKQLEIIAIKLDAKIKRTIKEEAVTSMLTARSFNLWF